MIMPGKSFQSKLEPHFDFILEARRKRQTLEDIAQALTVRGITTTKQAVHAFIKRRLKRRYPLGMAPDELSRHPPRRTYCQSSGTGIAKLAGIVAARE